MKKLLLLLLIPALAYAEPGPATRYLMGEPASLFDVAMLRLQHMIAYSERQMTFNYKLKSRSNPTGSGNVNAYYQPEDDKIYVVLSINDESATEQQMEAGCRYGLQHIRIYLGKGLKEMFNHVDDTSSSALSATDKAVYGMFELRCTVWGNDTSVIRFRASQTLAADEMTIVATSQIQGSGVPGSSAIDASCSSSTVYKGTSTHVSSM
jgi:hypothetical protein